MIFDCETYLLGFPVAGRVYELPDLELLLDDAGVDKAILMPDVLYKPQNDTFVEQARGNARFLTCALINPQFGAEAVAEVRRAVEEWGMRGIKLMPTKHGYPIHSKLLHPVMSACAELKIPVSIHSQGGYAHPLSIAILAMAFSEVPIIMDHMGYRYWVSEAIEAAKITPNIYLATTAVMEPHFIASAIEALGVDRIVYGSNAPLAIPKMQLDVIRFLQLSPEEEAAILGRTLAKLYSLGVPGDDE